MLQHEIAVTKNQELEPLKSFLKLKKALVNNYAALQENLVSHLYLLNQRFCKANLKLSRFKQVLRRISK